MLEVNSLAPWAHPSMLQGMVSFAALDFRKHSKRNQSDQSDDQFACVSGLLSLQRAQSLQLKKKGRAKQDPGNVLSGNLRMMRRGSHSPYSSESEIVMQKHQL
mmetsp:Transcript_55961/g.88749  ORF Transcript_55961/g.88749 Transcript_55961/m.88749 type:complete len:103 (+) Transcript_55961:778-1086(+)